MTHGDGVQRQIQKVKNTIHIQYTVILQITVLYEINTPPPPFVPSGLPSVLHAVLYYKYCSFWLKTGATKNCPFMSKVVLEQLENSDNKLESLAELSDSELYRNASSNTKSNDRENSAIEQISVFLV